MARFRIEPSRSRLHADARSSLHPIAMQTDGLEGEGTIEVVDGKLAFDPPPKGFLELEMGSLETGNILYDKELERRLETRRYPTLKASVKEVKDLGGGKVHVKGEIAFRGKTVPVAGDVTLKLVDASTIEVEGEQTFDMRQLGLDPPNLIVVKVYPDVKVRVKITAKRTGS